MLHSFRKFAKSKVALVLFGLLILSFGLFWGASDMLNDRGGNQKIASVGKETIDAASFQNKLKSEIENQAHALSRKTGKPVDVNELKKYAISSGMTRNILQQMIDTLTLRQEANRLGIQVSDEQVRETIKQLEYFVDDEGHFSKDKFQQVLHANNLSEAGFVENFREELTRNNLMSSLVGAVQSPQMITDMFHKHDLEQRHVKWVLLTEDLIPEALTPHLDEKALHAFYTAHHDMFIAPELRKLSALLMSIESLKSKHSATPSELREEFTRREAEFTKPESRKIFQIVTKDQASAEKAATLLKNRVKAHEIPKLLGENMAMGQDSVWVEQHHLPAKISQSIFGLQKGGHTAPLKTENGFYIFVVEDIKLPAKPDFHTIQSRLEDDLLKQKAKEELYDLVKKVEDEISAGSTFAEVARTHGLSVLDYDNIDAQGRNSDGKEVAAIDGALMAILKTGFETAEGMDSSTIELENGDMAIVKVEAITPSQLLPFDRVKEATRTFALREKRHEILERIAQKLTSEKASELSEEEGRIVRNATLGKPVPMGRNGQIQLNKEAPKGTPEHRLTQVLETAGGIPHESLDLIFTAKIGEASLLKIPYFDGEKNTAMQAFLVGKTLKIVPADESALTKSREDYRRMMTQALISDVLSFYIQGLQKKFPVKIHDGRLGQNDQPSE